MASFHCFVRVASACICPTGRWLVDGPQNTLGLQKVAALKSAARAVTMYVVSDELDPAEDGVLIDEEEEVDGLPVLAEVRPIESLQPVPMPAVQAAAVAATGFVAGAATVALVMRRSARRLARLQTGVGPSEAAYGVRTFLVHVHVLGRPGE